MQSSIGKRRSYESTERAGIPSFTSFRRVFGGVILLLIFSACTHTSKKAVSKPFAGLCLSGEGKGRIEHLDGRYVFSYENRLDGEKQDWLLGLSLPMHGEEILKLGFEQADQSKVQVKGKFFKRMSYAARKENKHQEIKRLRKVLAQIGVFLKAVHLVRIGDQPCENGLCTIGEKHKFKMEEQNDELLVTFDFDKNHKFTINARAKSSYYRKINFVLRDLRRKVDARQPFSLSLIHRDCSESL